MENNKLGLGVLLGGVGAFFFGKYLLSDEGAVKVEALLKKAKENKELQRKGIELLLKQKLF